MNLLAALFLIPLSVSLPEESRKGTGWLVVQSEIAGAPIPDPKPVYFWDLVVEGREVARTSRYARDQWVKSLVGNRWVSIDGTVVDVWPGTVLSSSPACNVILTLPPTRRLMYTVEMLCENGAAELCRGSETLLYCSLAGWNHRWNLPRLDDCRLRRLVVKPAKRDKRK